MPEPIPAPATPAPVVAPASQPITKAVTKADIAADAKTQHAHDEPSTLADNSIAAASKALRENKGAAPTPASATETEPAVSDGRARNPDGTFAKADETGATDASPDATGDEGSDATEQTDDAEPTEAPEPKVFKLAGEAQRGEEDIELDVTDLPPEVVERLERNEKQGMRRREFDQAMHKVAQLESNQVEMETRLRLNPEGFVLDNLAPATRLKVGAAILLEHWDEFAPDIAALWDDANARTRMLNEIKSGVTSRSQTVQQQVQTSVFVNSMKRAINATIPDGADTTDAVAYRAAAEAVIAQQIEHGTQVSPESVPALLASLAARYGFTDGRDNTPAEPPKRPKLAVVKRDAQIVGAIGQESGTRQPPQLVPSLAATAATVGGVQTIPSMSPERFQAGIDGRKAARNVAPQGAGAPTVRQPGPPENATVEEASAFLRGKKARR